MSSCVLGQLSSSCDPSFDQRDPGNAVAAAHLRELRVAVHGLDDGVGLRVQLARPAARTSAARAVSAWLMRADSGSLSASPSTSARLTGRTPIRSAPKVNSRPTGLLSVAVVLLLREQPDRDDVVAWRPAASSPARTSGTGSRRTRCRTARAARLAGRPRCGLRDMGRAQRRR